MLSQLPEQADPRRLCEQGKYYQGRIALQGLARLAPLLTSSEGEAAFTLRFGQDGEGRAVIRGHVNAILQVCCQRCMQPMPLAVDVGFLLSPVSGPQEAERLTPEYDPLLLDGRLLHPVDLIEDELILAIPPAPRHPEAACGVDLADYRSQDGAALPAEAEKENPFASLRQLRGDSGKHEPE